jgi:hypothetical protein
MPRQAGSCLSCQTLYTSLEAHERVVRVLQSLVSPLGGYALACHATT